jgi:hypothetical protein
MALGKPASAEQAADMWRRLSGREGRLYTGHCLIDSGSGRRVRDVASTVVRFGTPTDSELAAYIASGEPMSMAGAFSIEGLGAPFVDSIDGDPGNVIGLSLPLLRRMLTDIGIAITDLWRKRVLDVSCGVQKSPGQRAEREFGEFRQAEPGQVAEFAVGGCRDTADDFGFVDGSDVSGPVAVGVGDLIVASAEHIKQPAQPYLGADLLVGFADRRLRRGLTDLDGAA